MKLNNFDLFDIAWVSAIIVYFVVWGIISCRNGELIELNPIIISLLFGGKIGEKIIKKRKRG